MRNLWYMRHLFDYLKDRDYPLLEKLVIVMGLSYVFMPFDLLPEVMFPLGLLDDSLVALALYLYLGRVLKNFDLNQKEKAKQTWGKPPIKATYEEVKSGGENEERHQGDSD